MIGINAFAKQTWALGEVKEAEAKYTLMPSNCAPEKRLGFK